MRTNFTPLPAGITGIKEGRTMIRVKTKDIKRIVDATFPGYRKREVSVEARETVIFHDLNWSGGTKSEYRACGIKGESNARRLDMGRPAPWNNPYEGLKVEIPIDCVVVEGGYFCGQERMLRFYVHPANMPKFITA